MKISLFQGILMGVFGLGALIGLFVFATYTGKSTGTESIGSVVIWGTLPAASIQTALTLAVQTETTLKDVSYVEKSAASLPADLASAIATGDGPDLVLTSQEQLHAIKKFITPISPNTLSARTFANAFIQEGGLLAGSAGEGYYGLPLLVDPLVLYYNRNLLSSSGIAKPPSTWESLIGLVPHVATYSSTRQITRGLIALGTYDNVRNARAILSTLLLQQDVPISHMGPNGALVADLGKSTSNGVSAGQSVLGFYSQFADPAKISYTWNGSLPDSRQKFLSGDLALYVGYVSEVGFISSANPNLAFDVAPIPQPATARTKATHGLLYSLMIPRGAKNPSGAYQAAAIMTGDLTQSVLAGSSGLAPAALNALSIVPNESAGAVAYAEALYARGWLSPAPEDVNRVFSGMIGDVISGRSTLETALGNAENALSALLQKQ